ncbi:MAG: hypothetical protein R2867_39635 [Caldilineaceae bacterium]
MTAFPLGATIRRTDLETNPHPYLHRLRNRTGLLATGTNGWLITRYDLAIQVMRDAATFTVDHPDFSTAQVVGPSMLSLDGAAHQQHRAPLSGPFVAAPSRSASRPAPTRTASGCLMAWWRRAEPSCAVPMLGRWQSKPWSMRSACRPRQLPRARLV